MKFLFDGRLYNDFYLQLIKDARYRIVVHTYIFELDEFGANVYTELLEASHRGVSVSLVVDGFGTNAFRAEHFKEMKEKRVNYFVFKKMSWNNIYRWGRRLHHKVLLVDGCKAIVGGINIVTATDKEYIFPRLDFAFFLEGQIVSKIEKYCSSIFNRNEDDVMPTSIDFSVQQHIRFSVNDWVYNTKNIANSYTSLIEDAQSEIVIVNSYFFPRRFFLKNLIMASKRGVRVKLVLPKYSDWQSHVLASEYLYGQLLHNNIEIYQWDKSILHGKMMLVDKKILILGSFNLNYTSFQGNLELNVEIFSKEFVRNLSKEINDKIINSCRRVEMKEFGSQAQLFSKMKRLFYYLVISTASSFLLGFIHQEDLEKEDGITPRNLFFRIVASVFIFSLGLVGLILHVMPSMLLVIISFWLIYPVIMRGHKSN